MYNPNNTSLGDMEHCTVPLAKPNVHASHPFSSKQSHEKLLKYLRQRLFLGKEQRDKELGRLTRIDKNVAGWMKLSDEDKKRDAKRESDGTPVATNVSLPLNYVHLDDMMTYFAQTFAPNRGMFYQMGNPQEVDSAQQIVTIMNNHAVYSGYYREVLLGLFSLLKYNRGGYQCYWAREQGPKISKADDDTTQVDMQLSWQGNRLEAIDLYNFMCDPMIHPTKLHSDGEFAATAFLRSYYWLQNKASQGVYYNCNEALANYVGDSECKYYRNPPVEANFGANDANGSGTNWVSILAEMPAYAAQSGFEFVEVHIRINPTEFGLIQGDAATKATRNRLEIWRFTILNDTWIIDCSYMNNVHGHLPFYIGLLNDDLMSTAQKSVSEILQPLQDFASFLLNTHIAATRANIYGTTFFDPSIVDMNSVPSGEVAARIPIKAAGWGKDIRNAIYRHDGVLDTKQTLGDLESVMNVIGQFFPTQSLPSQIASIDRAVTNQVAAVQQGANRRQQKAARLLDDTLFRNVRFCMYYNIIQYQPDQSQITDFYTGKNITINLAELRNTDLPFIIGQGLKAIDRQAAADSLQQVIFALIQAPQAAQQIDVLGLIDYWTSMIDIEIDMKQFRLQPQQPGSQGGSEGTAVQTDAGGNPIQPATAPAAVTQPIYGG